MSKTRIKKGIKGQFHPHFGKPCFHSKKNKYKGIYMRSSWEIKFAQFLDLSGYKYLYEPKRFYFKDCTYCPDFYIPEWDLYIEIKGWFTDEAKKRIKLFKRKFLNLSLKILMYKDLQNIGILTRR